MCWEEVRERGRKRRVNLDWEREREGFFEKGGCPWRKLRKRGRGRFSEIEGKEREIQRKEI